MNYTYLPSHPFRDRPHSPLPASGPTIIMTSNPSSKKTLNLVANPNVSLLVHDWVSSRPPATGGGGGGSGQDRRERSPTGGPRSSLAAMLMQMNTTAMSSISATINGSAIVLEAGTEEERWCREQHLMNNTFDWGAEGGRGEGGGGGGGHRQHLFGSSPAQGGVPGTPEDGGRGSYIADEEVRVVVVRISDGRISDWKGGVKDWVIEPAAGRTGETAAAAAAPLVNGI